MFLRRRNLRVAILGCGPTALFALHAFQSLGYGNVSVLSKKRRSEMFGAQYLHSPIPGLSTISNLVEYKLRGTLADYAAKVYGGKLDPSLTSPANLPETHMAFDIRRAYYAAWDRYSDRVTNLQIQPSMMPDILGGFDLVVSTLPARQLCFNILGEHRFDVQKVWAVGDAPERGVFCPIKVDPFTVVCNGDATPSWYRASNVFGYKTAEWPGGEGSPRPPVENIAAVEKPVGTNCDCWLGKGFMRAGRYGTWTKGVLSHQAYQEITERY